MPDFDSQLSDTIPSQNYKLKGPCIAKTNPGIISKFKLKDTCHTAKILGKFFGKDGLEILKENFLARVRVEGKIFKYKMFFKRFVAIKIAVFKFQSK